MNTYDQGQYDVYVLLQGLFERIENDQLTTEDAVEYMESCKKAIAAKDQIGFVTIEYFSPNALPLPWQRVIFRMLEQTSALFFKAMCENGICPDTDPEIADLIRNSDTATVKDVMVLIGPTVFEDIVKEAMVDYNSTIAEEA